MYEVYSDIFPILISLLTLILTLFPTSPCLIFTILIFGFFCGVLIEFNQDHLCDHGLGTICWIQLGSSVNT